MAFDKAYSFQFPKDTPPEVIKIFSEAVKKVTENKEYQAEAQAMFMDPTYLSPEETSNYWKKAYEYYNSFEGLKPKK